MTVRIAGPLQGHTPRTEKAGPIRQAGFPAVREWDPDWRDHAACRDKDPEIWFPVGNVGSAALKRIEDAKAVCARCPVAASCLAWALGTGQDAGVWGGMSEDERRSMKRREAKDRQRAAAGGTS
jgi:WhiB family transcriptional regulator, redox-sensing transcriptional regulator